MICFSLYIIKACTVKMYSIIKTKKHFLSFLLFSIAVFISCSVIVSVFHNDDIRHETHPINHSPVCQWINEGKLCSRNTAINLSLPTTPFISFFTTFCTFAASLLLIEKHKEKNLLLNCFFLGSSLTTRAPPAK